MADLTDELEKWTTVHRVERSVPMEPARRVPRTDEEHDRIVDFNRRQRMARIDGLPADLRALVHEYGFHVVDTCMTLGIFKPRHIRHIVETVLNEFSPTRGATSAQGIKRAPGLSADNPLNKEVPSR